MDSKGGVTFSGGEPMVYPGILAPLLMALKTRGIHTNMETCGHCSPEALGQVIPFLDMIYYDLKHMDPEVHKEFTGTDNRQILKNFSMLSKSFDLLVPRMPLVPGMNDTKGNIVQTALFLKENGHDKIHCLPFHNMGESKLNRIQSKQAPMKLKSLTAEDCESAKQLFKTNGIEAKIYD